MTDQLRRLFLDALDPASLQEWILDHGLRILIILILAVIAYRLFYLIARRLARRMQALDGIEGSERDRRIETIFRLVANTGIVVVTTAATLTILQELDIDIGPLLASVGIVGLALGLGAQTLVKDIIGGLFIFVENMYTVGDVVEIAGYAGVVEEMTLRTTALRDLNGTLHVIPNGDIRTVSNRSRDWSRAVVEVGVTYEDHVAEAEAALEEAGRQLAAHPDVGPLLLEEPAVTGIEGLEDWQIRLRILVKTRPGKQFDVERELRRIIRAVFAERGLSLASPRQEVVLIQP
ncbi:MAG: mechanosensitive ion channel family protein [Candidatus Promineifilaceae bacterium]|nr:mechanosensitive ion channel family protein [Candidatus Promineifilaceae bacterium]